MDLMLCPISEGDDEERVFQDTSGWLKSPSRSIEVERDGIMAQRRALRESISTTTKMGRFPFYLNYKKFGALTTDRE